MAGDERLRELRQRRAKLAERLETLRTNAFSEITVPPLESILGKLDKLIAQREAESSED